MLEFPLSAVRSVVCLGAHCDDIEIGAGATIAALVAANPGIRVHWMVFSSTEERAAEARASAGDLLGDASAPDVQIRTYTDAAFPSELRLIKEEFEMLRKRIDPDLVFTHQRDDRHQDHRVISDLTWNTFRDHVILEYEVPKYDGDLGLPNTFVPAEDRFRVLKVETLLSRYVSQRSKSWFTPATFDGLMRLRGVECRSPTGYAEAFHARKIRLRTTR
jgi:LmbE family N-acetylglucosaminyl deacetylase